MEYMPHNLHLKTTGYGKIENIWTDKTSVMEFTADYGLKTRQVQDGFGCGEGY